MFGGVNKVILLGNLGKDPEVRTMSNGKEMASFSLATSDSWLDKSTGERVEKTDWHSVVVFSEPLVKLCQKFLSKGSKIYIEGALKTRKWTDTSNNDRYVTEIVLQGFNSLLKVVSSGVQSGSSTEDYDSSSSSEDSLYNLDKKSDVRGEEDLDIDINSEIDDEVPF